MATQGNLVGVQQGSTGTFNAIGLDAAGNPAAFPTGVVPVWTSSDPVNAPVTATVDGLTATVAVQTTAPVGSTVTLSVMATQPDGSTPTSGPVPVPILAGNVTPPPPPPPLPVVSIIITQANVPAVS